MRGEVEISSSVMMDVDGPTEAEPAVRPGTRGRRGREKAGLPQEGRRNPIGVQFFKNQY